MAVYDSFADNVDSRDISNVYNINTHIDDSYNHPFNINNWIKFSPTIKIDASNNVCIWLSSKGKICFKRSYDTEIQTGSLHNISMLLSNIYKTEIKVVSAYKQPDDTKKPRAIDRNKQQISTQDLILVEDDIFNPLQPNEFYYSDKKELLYKNTFLPSSYLLYQPKPNQQLNHSITLQYIYYLTNYNKNKFHFIMNWLATFFKDLKNRSKMAFVFLGNKKSGKEILFDEIIKPLFSKEYCLKITDTILGTPSVSNLLKNKLFYNIDNISGSIIKDKKTNKIINDLLCKDSIEVIENKESIIEYKIYGQTIITIDEAYLPYVDKEFESYSIFKIPDDIEQIYIPQKLLPKQTNDNGYEIKKSQDEKISKSELIKAIRADLENFALILKGYSVDIGMLHATFKDDDKKYLQNSLEDKLQAFHEAILNYQTSMRYFDKIKDNDDALYEVLTSDFDKKRVEQPNLVHYFALLYPEENISSGRTLMVQLRKIDEKFYNVSNIKYFRGRKYFALI